MRQSEFEVIIGAKLAVSPFFNKLQGRLGGEPLGQRFVLCAFLGGSQLSSDMSCGLRNMGRNTLRSFKAIWR